MIGPWQIAIIIAVIIMLFGAKKLPELAKALRLSANELKKPGDEKKPDEQ